MDIERRCSWCGKPFIAHNFGTRYCSPSCRRDAKRSNAKKVNAVGETTKCQVPEIGLIGNKPFLSPKDVAILLGTTSTSVYRYIYQGIIKAVKLSENRIVIRRSDLDSLFDNAPTFKKKKYGRKTESEYYTMREIIEKFGISRKAVRTRINKYNIPIVFEGRNSFFPKKVVNEKFAALTETVSDSDYYTIPQIMEKFGMSHSAVLNYVKRHNISRKTILRKVYYSREEIDKLKDPLKDEKYYTYPQLKQIYGLSKDQISYYTRAYHLTTAKEGKFTLIAKDEFDAIMRHRGNDGRIEKNDSIEDATIDALLKRKEEERQARIPEGYVSIEQIADKYAMTVKHVQNITRAMNIKEKKSIGGYNYFPSEVIEKAFAKYEAKPWVKLWISAKDMEELYMMTPEARRSFAYRHKIPTKQVKGKVFYSKEDIDKVKSDDFESRDKYYSVEQIMKKYGVTRTTVYNTVKYYKVGKVHKAQFSYFNKGDIDRIFKEKRGKS